MPSPRLEWVLHGLIKAAIAMPGEKTPTMVYAAALLVLELGDLNAVDAAALQGKPFEDFIGIAIYCIISSSRRFCSVTTGSFGLSSVCKSTPELPQCSTLSPPLMQAAEPFVGPLQIQSQEWYLD